MALAQYDIILTQNTANPGPEFAENNVNIAKGGLLSANASHVPTVLAGGVDGYILVRDDIEETGLKWIANTSHTQNTDTGTTENIFTVDSDSVTGKIIVDVALGAADYSLTLTNEALTASDKIITFPNRTGMAMVMFEGVPSSNIDTGTEGWVGYDDNYLYICVNANTWRRIALAKTWI